MWCLSLIASTAAAASAAAQRRQQRKSAVVLVNRPTAAGERPPILPAVSPSPPQTPRQQQQRQPTVIITASSASAKEERAGLPAQVACLPMLWLQCLRYVFEWLCILDSGCVRGVENAAHWLVLIPKNECRHFVSDYDRLGKRSLLTLFEVFNLLLIRLAAHTAWWRFVQATGQFQRQQQRPIVAAAAAAVKSASCGRQCSPAGHRDRSSRHSCNVVCCICSAVGSICKPEGWLARPSPAFQGCKLVGQSCWQWRVLQSYVADSYDTARRQKLA